jgi:hypothetical protein
MIIIYALCEPDTGEVRYVGKAKDLKKRIKWHKKEKGSTRKCRWLQSLASRGLEPLAVVLAEVSDGSWRDCERAWIAYYRQLGCDLCNHTDGGDGLNNPDQETRSKISAITKSRMSCPAIRAKIFTAERASKISASLTGVLKTKEHIANLPQNTKGGRSLSPEHKAKLAASNSHKWSREEIELIRVANIGNKYAVGNKNRTGQRQSESERAKKSAALSGRPKTDEHREKIRQGLLRAWAKRRDRNVGVQVCPDGEHQADPTV